MYLLGCFFMLILVVLFWFIGIGLSILTFFFRLFGINYPRTNHKHNNSQSSEKSQQQKKVFSDNEGEYIDFEEV